MNEFSFLWKNVLNQAKKNPSKNTSEITNETKPKKMNRISDLIANGRLDQALTLFREQYNLIEVKQLQSRLKTLNRENRMGILSSSEANLIRNKITADTLNLLSALAKEASTPEPPAPEAAEPKKATRSQEESAEVIPTVGKRGVGKRKEFTKEVSNVIEIVGAAPKFIPFEKMEEKVKILFISATPTNARQLNVARESRFKDLFKYFDDEDIFEWREEHGVNTDEFFNFLIKEKPHILHYGGHGEVEGIVLEKGKLEGDILKNLLKISKRTQCLVLNACYSVAIAKKVAECVPYVIGTQGEIDDETAIAFAKGFYMGIVAGDSIEDAFQFGLLKIQQKQLPDGDIPILVKGVQKKEM